MGEWRRSAAMAAAGWMVLGLAAFGSAGPGFAEEVLTVDVATFEGGRFVVAGTAPPGAEVRVVGTDVANEADPKTGAFRIARRTVLPACTVTVESGTLSAEVPVANCKVALLGVETPQPTTLLRPRGGWNSTRTYKVNDVVEWDGKSWRAVKDGRSRQPALGDNGVFWVELPPGEDPTLVPATGVGAASASSDPEAAAAEAPADVDPGEADAAEPQ